MASPTIKARLVLIPEGGAIGGGTGGGGGASAEDKTFKIEQLKANKTISSLLGPLLRGILGAGGLAAVFTGALATLPALLTGGLLLGQQLPAVQERRDKIRADVDELVQKRKEEKAAKKNTKALEELEKSAISLDHEGLQQMEDGTINLNNAIGETVFTFGKGNFDITAGFQGFKNVMEGVSQAIPEPINNVLSALSNLANRMNATSIGGRTGPTGGANFTPMNANFSSITGAEVFIPPPKVARTSNVVNQSLINQFSRRGRANRSK